MVHALLKTRELLAPGGRLIDIHPLEDPRPIEVRIADQVHLAGWLQEADDYIEYVQAGEAIAQAIRQGWFVEETKSIFRFTYYADTIIELRNHLSETSEDMIVDDLVVMRVTDLMHSTTEDQSVMMHIPVQVSRLRPLP